MRQTPALRHHERGSGKWLKVGCSSREVRWAHREPGSRLCGIWARWLRKHPWASVLIEELACGGRELREDSGRIMNSDALRGQAGVTKQRGYQSRATGSTTATSRPHAVSDSCSTGVERCADQGNGRFLSEGTLAGPLQGCIFYLQFGVLSFFLSFSQNLSSGSRCRAPRTLSRSFCLPLSCPVSQQPGSCLCARACEHPPPQTGQTGSSRHPSSSWVGILHQGSLTHWGHVGTAVLPAKHSCSPHLTH